LSSKKKVCPIASGFGYCKQNECALWNPMENQCSLKYLISALNEISREIKALRIAIIESA